MARPRRRIGFVLMGASPEKIPEASLEDKREDHALRWSTISRSLSNPAARRGLIAIAVGVAIIALPSLIITVVAVGAILAGMSDLTAAVRHRLGWSQWAESLLII